MVTKGMDIDQKQSIPRRKVLIATGALGATTMAGCLSGDDEGGGGTDMVIDEAMDTSTPPRDMNWNPFAAEKYNSGVAQYVNDWGAMLFLKDKKLRSWGFKDWNYDTNKNVYTITLRDDIKKQNGKPYTGEDLRVYDEMVRLQSPETSKYEAIELAEKNTVEYHLKKKVNPDIFEKYILITALSQGKGRWQSWYEKYSDATTQKERDAITKDLSKLKISNEEFKKKGRATGVFKLDSVDDNGFSMKVWEDHRNADKIAANGHKIHIAAETARYNSLLTKDKADIGRSQFPNKLKSGAPDYLENLSEFPTMASIKVLINWRNKEYLRDRNVRRAMAAVIDTKQIAKAAGNAKPVPVHSGIDPTFQEGYLGNNIDNYIDYKPKKKDYKLADKFLERSGYKRENGEVKGPDGSKLEPMRFTIGNNIQWRVAGKFAAKQLKKYGFDVKSKVIKRSNKLDVITQPKTMDKWDLTTENHYAPTVHPFQFFDYRTFRGWRLIEGDWSAATGAIADIKKWLKEGKEFSPYNGKPMKPEIPVKIGQQDLSGKTKKLNIYELIEEIRTPISKKRQKEIIQDLSWAWNFHMPDIDTYVLMGGMWGDTKHWEWGGPEWAYTGVYSNSMYYVTKQGLVKPKKK